MRFLSFAATAAGEEAPLIVQLWRDFLDVYVLNEPYYEYLGFEGKDLFNLKLLILGLFLGLGIAGFGAVYDKRVLGEMVRSLLNRGCLSPEEGRTLADLGLARNSIVRHSVRKSVSLRRVVKCVEEEQFLAEQEKRRAEHEEKRKSDKSIGRFREIDYVFDLEHDHFYIPEKMKYVAEIKFEKKGTTWLGAIIFLILLLIAYIILLIALPGMLDIINDYVANFQPRGPKNIV